MLTLPEVAERLACATVTVRRLVASGRLRAVNVGAGSKSAYRVREVWLVEFMEREAVTFDA
jgi:excisionase family DNA binding protein